MAGPAVAVNVNLIKSTFNLSQFFFSCETVGAVFINRLFCAYLAPSKKKKVWLSKSSFKDKVDRRLGAAQLDTMSRTSSANLMETCANLAIGEIITVDTAFGECVVGTLRKVEDDKLNLDRVTMLNSKAMVEKKETWFIPLRHVRSIKLPNELNIEEAMIVREQKEWYSKIVYNQRELAKVKLDQKRLSKSKSLLDTVDSIFEGQLPASFSKYFS